jgi:hypothetical protein
MKEVLKSPPHCHVHSPFLAFSIKTFTLAKFHPNSGCLDCQDGDTCSPSVPASSFEPTCVALPQPTREIDAGQGDFDPPFPPCERP